MAHGALKIENNLTSLAEWMAPKNPNFIFTTEMVQAQKVVKVHELRK